MGRRVRRAAIGTVALAVLAATGTTSAAAADPTPTSDNPVAARAVGRWTACPTPTSTDCIAEFTVDGAVPPAGIELIADLVAANNLNLAVWNTNDTPLPPFGSVGAVPQAPPDNDLTGVLSANSQLRIVLNVGAQTFGFGMIHGKVDGLSFPPSEGSAAGVITLNARPQVISAPSDAEVASGTCGTGQQPNDRPLPFVCTVQQASNDRLQLFGRIYRGDPGPPTPGWYTWVETNAAFSGVPYLDTDGVTIVERLAAPTLRADGSNNVGTFKVFVSEAVIQQWTSNGGPFNPDAPPVVIRSEDGSATVVTASYMRSAEGLLVTVEGVTYSAPSYLVSPCRSSAAQASAAAGSLAGAESVVAVAPVGFQALRRRRFGVRRTLPRRERVRSALTWLMVAGVAVAVLAACQPVKKAPPIC